MKKVFALILSLTICLGTTAPALAVTSPFRDVPSSHWAYSYIQQAYNDEVMTGTYYHMASGIREFSPDSNLTLAELITVLTRAFYNDEVEAASAAGAWYAKNVAVAKAHGLLAGIDENSMTATATRYQMALIMTGVMEDKGAQMPSSAELAATQATIPDWSSVPSQYRTAVATVYYLGIIVGVDSKGTFNGTGYVTRAATAVIYVRLRDATASLMPDTPTDPDPDTTTGDTTFAMLAGESTVQTMMNRINAATPAYREGYLTNGQPITTENIQAMLVEIQKSMPHGTTWNTDGKYNYRSTLGYGGGCNSFAYAVSDAIFGEDAPLNKHQNFDDLKVGDVIWVKTATDGGHVYVVTGFSLEPMPLETYGVELNADGYVYACSGNVDGMVGWNGYESISRIKTNSDYSSTTYIYSRY